MWLHLLFLAAAASCHPLQEDADLPNINTTTSIDPEKLEKDLKVVSYVQNFKHAIAEYVTSEYNTLTTQETEQIMKVLENFLINFASDLKKTVQKEDSALLLEVTTEVTKVDEIVTKTSEVVTTVPENLQIQDGLPNETFDEIEQRIKTDFPELKDETIKEIIYKLRKNLYEAKLKIDRIILDSQRSQNVEERERK